MDTDTQRSQITLSLLVDDIILDIKDPKDPTKRLRELTNNFKKVAGYKIDTWKSVVFLYASDKYEEKEIRNIISFTILTKIPGNKPNKEFKDLYNESFKTWKKETEEDTRIWKSSHAHALEVYSKDPV